MDLAFSPAINGSYPLGASCHQQMQGAVPVWVVTDVHGNILINSQANTTEGPQWVVAKGRITVTRFWSASTAMIVCNVEALSRSPGEPKDKPFPSLTNNVTRVLLGGGYGTTGYPLDKNDEICIWCGYIDGLRPVTEEDLKSGRLIRTFVGVVDTLVGSGSVNQGTTLIIQCRDRMKYLMDSLSTYNSTDFIPIGLAGKQGTAEEGQTDFDTAKADTNNVGRVEVILELARRSIGHLENAFSLQGDPACACVCGLKISQGYTKDFIFDNVDSDSIFSVYEGTREGRTYFGIPMSDSSAPPPNTVFSALAAAQKSSQLDIEDSKLSPDQLEKKYKDLASEYKIELPGFNPFRAAGDAVATVAENFRSTSANEAAAKVAARNAKNDFLAKYKETFGTDYTGDTSSEAPVPLSKLPPLTEAEAIRLLNQVDAKLSTKDLYDKYNNLSLSKIGNAVFIPPFTSAEEGARMMREQTLEAYKVRFLRHYALDDPAVKALYASGAAKSGEEGAEAGEGTPFIGGYVTTPPGLSDIEIAIRARHPSMNIITGRMPYPTSVGFNNFAGMSSQVTDRVPIEYIKFLAMQEPWPTEFFCDHRSGEYWYAPRGLDISGLDDPDRFYRTYFYRHAPESALSALGQEYAHPCQALLLYREESSSINWRSNIIVTNAPSVNSAESYGTHLKLVPPFLAGRAFACTYYTVVDETIGNSTTELVATAMAFARLYGKELKAASMHIIGDPSMTPGEAIQVIGSPLYGGGQSPAVQDSSKEQWDWDRSVVKDYVTDYKNVHSNLLDDLKQELTQGSSGEGGGELGTLGSSSLQRGTIDRAVEGAYGNIAASSPTSILKNNATNSQITASDLSGLVESDVNQILLETEKYRTIFNKFGLESFDYAIKKSGASLSDANATLDLYRKTLDETYKKTYGVSFSEDPNAVADSGLSVSQLKDKYEVLAKNNEIDLKLNQGESVKAAYYRLYNEKFKKYPAAEVNPAQTESTQPGAAPPGSTGNTSISDLDDQRSKVQALQTLGLTQAELMCPAKFGGEGVANSDSPLTYREDPRSIWRCEAVIHKFNDSPGDGYKTEIALLSPW